MVLNLLRNHHIEKKIIFMLVLKREKHTTIVIEIQIFRQKYIVIVNKQYIERHRVVGKK